MSQSFGGGDATCWAEHQTLLQRKGDVGHTLKEITSFSAGAIVLIRGRCAPRKHHRNYRRHHRTPPTAGDAGGRFKTFAQLSLQTGGRSRRGPGWGAAWCRTLWAPSFLRTRQGCPGASPPRWASRSP